MAKFKFTATHGVHLDDLGVAFARTEDRIDDEGRGHKRYAFETDDALLAAALLDVEGYGIRTDDDSRRAAESAAKKAADARAKAEAEADAEVEAKAKADAEAKAAEEAAKSAAAQK